MVWREQSDPSVMRGNTSSIGDGMDERCILTYLLFQMRCNDIAFKLLSTGLGQDKMIIVPYLQTRGQLDDVDCQRSPESSGLELGFS